MSEPGSFRNAFPRDSRAILRLAGPLVVNNLVIAGMMLTNTVVAGRLGPGPLAGVAVGGSYYQMFWLFGLGVLMSISPLVAHAYGGGRDPEVGRRFRQGIWLALMLAVARNVSRAACIPISAYRASTNCRASSLPSVAVARPWHSALDR